jgi:hypothetical protein
MYLPCTYIVSVAIPNQTVQIKLIVASYTRAAVRAAINTGTSLTNMLADSMYCPHAPPEIAKFT